MRGRAGVAGVAALLALWVAGCASLGLGRRSEVLDFAESVAGVDWYGVYLGGRKLGHARTFLAVSEAGVEVGLELRAQLVGVDRIVDFEVDSLQVFSRRPPHRFLRSRTARRAGGGVEQVEIAREEGDIWATVRRDGGVERHAADLGDYTLEDVMRQDLWLLAGPAPGDELAVRLLHGEEFRLVPSTVSVRTVQDGVIEGVPRRYYVLAGADFQGGRVVSVVDESAHVLGLQLADQLRLQLEPRESAVDLGRVRRLLIGATVPVDRPLGEASRVTRLELAAFGESASKLGRGPGQRLDYDHFGGRWVVSIDPSGAASEAEPGEPAPRPARPALEERLAALAREAVAGAERNRERVRALLAFVADHVEDAVQLDPLPLAELLDHRRGDASEHAQLFVALAEQLGMRARAVHGLRYVGDAQRGFGPHTWAEVVIDGSWVPVDPTWVQLPVDATHVRVSDGDPERRDRAVDSDLALQVLAVDFDRPAP